MIYLKGWLFPWLVMDHSVHMMKIKPTLQINLVWAVVTVVPSADTLGLSVFLSRSLPVFHVCHSSLNICS